MWRVLCCGLVLCLSLLGCARTEKYQLIVEPGFSADQEKAIVLGAYSWEAVVPVRFDVKLEVTCPDPLWKTICVRSRTFDASSKHWGETDSHDELDYSSYVYLDPQEPSSDWQMTAAHELGHAQGLVHHGKGTLMYAIADENEARSPTQDDIDQWWHLHQDWTPEVP